MRKKVPAYTPKKSVSKSRSRRRQAPEPVVDKKVERIAQDLESSDPDKVAAALAALRAIRPSLGLAGLASACYVTPNLPFRLHLIAVLAECVAASPAVVNLTLVRLLDKEQPLEVQHAAMAALKSVSSRVQQPKSSIEPGDTNVIAYDLLDVDFSGTPAAV